MKNITKAPTLRKHGSEKRVKYLSDPHTPDTDPITELMYSQDHTLSQIRMDLATMVKHLRNISLALQHIANQGALKQ